MGAHAILGPSKAKQLSKCPQSVKGPDTKAGFAAAEGTALHAVREAIVRGEKAPEVGDAVEVDGHRIVFTNEALNAARVSAETLMSEQWIGEIHLEAAVNFASYLDVPHNLAFGTTDAWGFIATADGVALHVNDAKFGRNEVLPEMNLQHTFYAAGVLQWLDEQGCKLPRSFPVKFSVSQPRVSFTPAEWWTTVGWVEDTMFMQRKPMQAAVRFFDGTATQDDERKFPRIPGPHCAFCKVKASKGCKQFNDFVLRAAEWDSTKGAWDVELWKARSVIKTHLDEMKQFAQEQALAGNVLPGTKLVEGRAAGATFGEGGVEAVIEVAKSASIDPLLIKWMEPVHLTPAQARDLLKARKVPAEKLQGVIIPGAKVPTITDDTDNRPAWTPESKVDTSAFSVQAQTSTDLSTFPVTAPSQPVSTSPAFLTQQTQVFF